MGNIKTITMRGDSPGMNVVVLAGVHGNEICGTRAFDELIPKLDIKRGKVTFIYSNLEAQKQNVRFVGANLNRCFLDEQPRELVDTLEGKTARAIIPYLKEADICLDLHSSWSAKLQKYIICEEDFFEIAGALKPEKIITGIDAISKGGTDGYMFNLGKLGICVECGETGSEDSVEFAKETLLSFLKKVGSIDGDFEEYSDKKKYVVCSHYKNEKGPFKLSGEYNDFYEFSEKSLLGTDGEDEVYVEGGDVLMFPIEQEEIGKECFMIIRELESSF